METSLRKCENAILRAPSLEINDLIQNAKSLTKKAKSLTSVGGNYMQYISPSLSLSHLLFSLSLISLTLSLFLSFRDSLYIRRVRSCCSCVKV